MSRSFAKASSEYLEVGASPITSLDLTMAIWAKHGEATPAAAQQGVFWYGNKDNSADYMILDFNGENLELWARHTGVLYTSSGTDYADGAFHHILGTYYDDGGTPTGELYIDGSLDGSDTGAGTPEVPNFDRIAVGRFADSSPGNYFEGETAEAAMWNVRLTAAEAAMLGQGYSPLFVRPQNLVFYLPMIRDNDNDLVGGLSLTAFNTPSIAVHPSVIYPWNNYNNSFTPAAGDITITADPGTFTWTGFDASLEKGSKVSAESGTYTLTGQDVSLLKDSVIPIDAGSFIQTGFDAALSKGRTITADAGSFVLTGQDVILLKDALVSAESGAFVLTGFDATLTPSEQPVGIVSAAFTPSVPDGAFTASKPDGAFTASVPDTTFTGDS